MHVLTRGQHHLSSKAPSNLSIQRPSATITTWSLVILWISRSNLRIIVESQHTQWLHLVQATLCKSQCVSRFIYKLSLCPPPSPFSHAPSIAKSSAMKQSRIPHPPVTTRQHKAKESPSSAPRVRAPRQKSHERCVEESKVRQLAAQFEAKPTTKALLVDCVWVKRMPSV